MAKLKIQGIESSLNPITFKREKNNRHKVIYRNFLIGSIFLNVISLIYIFLTTI